MCVVLGQDLDRPSGDWAVLPAVQWTVGTKPHVLRA